MSSPTITLTVPRAESESLFLLQVVQEAIRAYRECNIESHDLKISIIGLHQSVNHLMVETALSHKSVTP